MEQLQFCKHVKSQKWTCCACSSAERKIASSCMQWELSKYSTQHRGDTARFPFPNWCEDDEKGQMADFLMLSSLGTNILLNWIEMCLLALWEVSMEAASRQRDNLTWFQAPLINSSSDEATAWLNLLCCSWMTNWPDLFFLCLYFTARSEPQCNDFISIPRACFIPPFSL